MEADIAELTADSLSCVPEIISLAVKRVESGASMFSPGPSGDFRICCCRFKLS